MNILFIIGSAIIFFLGWLYVKNYILTPYITKKTGVTTTDWPPSNTTKFPDYWTNRLTTDGKDACWQSSALSNFYNQKDNNNFRTQSKYPKWVNSVNDQRHYTIEDLKTTQSDCSNPDSVDCKCAVSKALCTPWTGVTDMERCRQPFKTNCTEDIIPTLIVK